MFEQHKREYENTMREHEPSFNFTQNFGADTFDILAVAEQSGVPKWGAGAHGQFWPYANYGDEVRRLETPMSCFQLSLIFCQDMLGTNKR